MSIHPTAIIAEGAVVPASCDIGPYCVVGESVVFGESCEMISHAIVDGHTRLGARNKIFPFASVGIAPQDLTYAGEPTRCEIGDDNVVRESVTISRGTIKGGGLTRVGSGCLIMAYTHIGHDSIIGNGCILANAATLAGHVIVEDFAVVGAMCPIHQFCRIGKYSYVGGGTTITQDVLPYSLTSAKRDVHAYSLNKLGLQRRGFTADRIRRIQHAFKVLQASKLNTSQAMEKLRSEGALEAGDDVRYFVEFIESAERGVLK